MKTMSWKRFLGAAAVLLGAALAGAALPAESGAVVLCEEQDCRAIFGGCEAGSGSYCHDYGWDCFDGGCEGP